jgi:nucleoside-diphosphate-sugar epimerase
LLLVGLEGDTGEALVTRLLGHGDDVRVVESDPRRATRWRALGAHVAPGDPTDPDLVERAAEGVRSIVVIERGDAELRAVVEAVAIAARSSGARVIVGASVVDAATRAVVIDAGIEHVLLSTSGARRSPWARRAGVRSAIAAIDAADDLAGEVRLDLDLTQPEAWSALRLPPG